MHELVLFNMIINGVKAGNTTRLKLDPPALVRRRYVKVLSSAHTEVEERRSAHT